MINGFSSTQEHREYTRAICNALCIEAASQRVEFKSGDAQCCIIGGKTIYVENVSTGDEFNYVTNIYADEMLIAQFPSNLINEFSAIIKKIMGCNDEHRQPEQDGIQRSD